MTEKVRVWDVPVRLFHWSLLGLFTFSWWSGENHEMEWHRQSGLLIVALLLFRVFWGLAGSRTARFAQFVKWPGEVLAYARKASDEHATDGHNPLGGWSVAALLLVLLTLVTAGLFSVDVDGLESGPLAGFLSFDGGRAAAEIHEIAFKAALTLIGLHVCAIGYYQFLVGRDLIGPMITGRRDLEAGETVESVRWSPLRALIGLAVILALVWAISKGFQFASAGDV
ncbi:MULTISPECIES: cytochrome b/b6 domain-containing protein [unclassified Novosphingobium]|uniref:cytochrome b/b6 domain-containing protein n=1 Tax=unclassified Novosphingobium TaxID=2644732 RepID=UPI0025E77AD2|nr:MULTISPECIES: cytochrome b/b6 domain-containing protein [unclassified Novosphingobium]HQS68669.1 cytochrome b/b6 domain-containing protein [Novosphingobium sp.]